jgi:hypothetical protein
MRLTRALPFALFLLTSHPVLAGPEAPAPVARSQVEPDVDLAALYPQAGHIGLAVAIVPDPHVPRYRRLFDLEVQAIQLGMLRDGYVLDRYSFPWSRGADEGPDDPGAFGLMIFRCDGWRGRPCMDTTTQRPRAARQRISSTRIRAVYFITDTATWGVSEPQLLCVAKQINALLPGGVPDAGTCPAVRPHEQRSPRVGLLQFPGCPSGDRMKTLVLLGPTFSGAVDSMGQNLGKILGPEMTDACLVSGFTTVGSNFRTTFRYEKLHYARLALDDGVKLLGLANLARSFGYFVPGDGPEPDTPRREVAFLAEASTFGYGVCSPSETMPGPARERVIEFCSDAQVLYFPAAIADIRYGLDQQREQQKNQVQAAVQVALPSDHLMLEAGAENGSEFPESRQSTLTAASQQLALDRLFSRLEQSDPRMVVVVATDVRDRLFLFDQLRERLPSAMLIDLETDVLLAHPDFLHASRGAVTVSSANLFVQGGRLFGCEKRVRGANTSVLDTQFRLASWAIDGQGMLADAVSRLSEPAPPITAPPCIAELERANRRMPVLHVVTLKGLRPVSRAFERNVPTTPRAQRVESFRRWRQITLDIAQRLALFCCIVVVLPWMWIRPMQHAVKGARYYSPRLITAVTGVAACIAWASAMFAAYGVDDPESGYALAYWSIAILALAIGGLYICVKRVRECGPGAGKLPRRHRWAIRVVGLIAVGLACVPIAMRGNSVTYLPPDPDLDLVDRLPLDADLVMRLALDIGQGLAYHVVTAVGVVTVLFVMVSLATGACIMTRNNGLLAIRAGCRDTDSGPRTPRFPKACILGMILLIALIAVPSLVPGLGGPRLSIFGPGASLVATLVLVMTTFGASILTSVAIHASRRIRTMAAHISRCVSPPMPEDREYPGLWPPNDWQPNLFAATPVVARVSSDVVCKLNEGTLSGAPGARSWKKLIGEFLAAQPAHNDGPHRRAVYALLASEISLYRWFVGGAVLCALASVCAAYLFPIEADPLILWNLGVLVVHALLAGYVATAFERDVVLSNILCNRPKKAAFSGSLFAYAAMPFLALGFAIAVSQVPGVVDWGGGVLALLRALGLRL